MSSKKHAPPVDGMTEDMAKGFRHFADEVLRGRENKTILNSSIGLAALETGIPASIDGLPLDIARMVINNRQLLDRNIENWGSSVTGGSHPLFDFSTDNFTLFGLDFNSMGQEFSEAWQQFFSDGSFTPIASEHSTPLYENTVATSLGLPDLPYGGMAHFAHMGLALYDTGRTFQDLWNEPALKHNVVKIMTHPEMTETLLHRGVMLTVMGLTHMLNPIISIALGYLCGHLVHSFFKLLNNHKDGVREIENVPVLKHIYNATGIKEWAEAKKDVIDEPKDAIDPLEAAPETGLPKETPIPSLHHIEHDERLTRSTHLKAVEAL